MSELQNLSLDTLLGIVLHNSKKAPAIDELIRRGGVSYIMGNLEQYCAEPDPFHVWLQEIVDSGWEGQGMHDPEKTMTEIKYAIRREQPWDELPEAAKKKYKSISYHQGIWATDGNKPYIVPAACLAEV